MFSSVQAATGQQSDTLNLARVLKCPDVSDLVFSVSDGSILMLGGINAQELFTLLENEKPSQNTPCALSIAVNSASSAEAIINEVITCLAETALRLWPTWYHDADVSFNICGNDSLGRQAACVLASEAGRKIAGVLPFWAEQATVLALSGHVPRVSGLQAATEFEQLAKVISPNGLILVVSLPSAYLATEAEALVRALEWLSKTCAVVALFDKLPVNKPPFDRISYGAYVVSSEPSPEVTDPIPPTNVWIAPWRGMPHPLSEAEKRLAAMIAADNELKVLFSFNQSVATVCGSSPKVDLLWAEGRLVVELDGYESHGNRTAFAQDRHRDYELMLSGYAVLRLTNVEIAQDCEKALEKIRDLVRLRHQTLTKEV